jgi:hypothetical protein
MFATTGISIDATTLGDSCAIGIGNTNTTGNITIGNTTAGNVQLISQNGTAIQLSPAAGGLVNITASGSISIDALPGGPPDNVSIGIGANWTTGPITIGNGGAGAGTWYSNTSLTFDAASPANVPISIGGTNTTSTISIGNPTAAGVMIQSQNAGVEVTSAAGGAVEIFAQGTIIIDAASPSATTIQIGATNTSGVITIGNAANASTVLLQSSGSSLSVDGTLVSVAASGFLLDVLEVAFTSNVAAPFIGQIATSSGPGAQLAIGGQTTTASNSAGGPVIISGGGSTGTAAAGCTGMCR